jgi:hypothetical protein
VHPERFKFLVPYERLIHGGIRGELLMAHGVPTAKLRITEGTLLVAERADLSALEPEFTPSALPALQLFRQVVELRKFPFALSIGVTQLSHKTIKLRDSASA